MSISAKFSTEKQNSMPKKTTNFETSKWRTAAVLKSVKSPYFSEQEDQLSQTDRATLRVTEYFAKSLKVTQCLSK